MPETDASKFDLAVDAAANAILEVRRAKAPKLSAGAFVQQTYKISDAVPRKVPELDKLLRKGEATTAEVRAFVRRLVQEYQSPNYPMPIPPLRALHCFASSRVAQILHEHGFTSAEANCLAAERAATDPDRFGDYKSVKEMSDAPRKLQDKLDECYDQMRATLRLDDLMLDASSLTSAERQSGLICVTFKRAPHVALNDPKWCERLAEHHVDYRGEAVAAPTKVLAA